MRHGRALLTERRDAALVRGRELALAHRLDEIGVDVLEDGLHGVRGVVEALLVLRAAPELHQLDGAGLGEGPASLTGD